MQSFDALEKQVDNGSLVVINTVSVPRSISTALGRALNETAAASVFVNEPFSRNCRDQDAAASQILEAVVRLPESSGQQTTVITKNMANYLSPEIFQRLASLSAATIWTVRDPLVQMGSLLTRIVNDITVGRGANYIKQEELEPYLDEASTFLESSERSQRFSKTGWKSIGEHYDNYPRPDRSIIVDGGELSIDPVSILKRICHKTGLTYSSRMREGWRRDYVNASNGDDKRVTAENAWSKQAATSIGIVAVSRAPLELARLPPAIRQHLAEIALPVYNKLTSSPD